MLAPKIANSRKMSTPKMVRNRLILTTPKFASKRNERVAPQIPAMIAMLVDKRPENSDAHQGHLCSAWAL